MAESARANLTPARCHHPWVQAFDSLEQLARGTGMRHAGRVHGWSISSSCASARGRAVPLVGMMIVAAVWFGEIRLRTPYDPLALLLAFEAIAAAGGWLLARRTGDQNGSDGRQTRQ